MNRNWIEIELKLNCNALNKNWFWNDVNRIDLKLTWNWIAFELNCFELMLQLKLNSIELIYNWLDLKRTEIELNWIDYGLNWFYLNLNCIEWNWVEMCRIESKLNWTDFTRFEVGWHWINLIELNWVGLIWHDFELKFDLIEMHGVYLKLVWMEFIWFDFETKWHWIQL